MKKAFFKRTFFKRTWILSVCLYTLLGHQSLTLSASGDSDAFAVGLIITTAVVVLRHQIKDTIVSAYKSLIFDKKQIPSVYTDAIVRIHGISTEPDCLSIMGTASIIRSERNSDDYFAITAAHCVEKTKFNRLQVKNPHYVAGGDSPRFIHVNAEPIIVDEVADTAVLHIRHEALQDFFQKTDNGPLPYIPASALSSAMPGKNEVLVAQGYPGSINNDRCYKKKMIAREPAFRFIRTPGDRTLRRSFLMGTFNCENLPGLSGGPVVMVKDKGAYIVGRFFRSLSARF